MADATGAVDADTRGELLRRYRAALEAVGRAPGYIDAQITTGRTVDVGLLRRVAELAERTAARLAG